MLLLDWIYPSYTAMSHYSCFDHKDLVPHKVQRLWNSCETAMLQIEPRSLSLKHAKFRFSSQVRFWCHKIPAVVEKHNWYQNTEYTPHGKAALLNQQWK